MAMVRGARERRPIGKGSGDKPHSITSGKCISRESRGVDATGMPFSAPNYALTSLFAHISTLMHEKP